MSNLFQAFTTDDLRTENGMPTHSTSGSYVVDFYYESGGYRKARKPLGDLVGVFFAAYGENPRLALKALFNLRDPRGGKGERLVSRVIWHALAMAHPEIVRKALREIPDKGRWDDVFALLDTPVEQDMLDFVYEALMAGDKNLYKWMPREKKSQHEVAKFLMEKFGLTPRQYRKMLSEKTQVVETLMCERRWRDIRYSSVPSHAMKNYYKAFFKNDKERFEGFLASVEKGEAKINAGTLTPVDILHRYLSQSGRDATLEALWKAQPDYVPAHLQFIPVCDLSASMTSHGYGRHVQTTGPLPIEVSISLGIYLAERNRSIFRDEFIIFSARPKFIHLTGKTLWDKLNQMRSGPAENTDLGRVFDEILSKAVAASLPEEDMPQNVLIISDMQFDSCMGNVSDNALKMITRKYAEARYRRPDVFFWNVATAGGIPAKITDSGVGLVSGYSPSLLRSVLTGDLNPIRQVEAILNVERYAFVDAIV